jgi:uncharacterized protein RhaS with RHS repeats
LVLSSTVFQAQAFYHPDEGRWISRDPIEEDGGVNLYTFVYNDPLNATDSMGESVEFRRNQFTELLNKLRASLSYVPECKRKMKEAEADARKWFNRAKVDYTCCDKDGEPFGLEQYPGAVEAYAGNVPYGDRHTYGVQHCALGYYAKQKDADKGCLSLANAYHEFREFIKLHEWLPGK